MGWHAVGVIWGVVSLLFAGLSIALFREARRMRKTSTSRLSDAQDGLLELSGEVTESGAVMSPVTDRLVGYAECTIVIHSKGAKSETIQKNLGDRITLRDATATVTLPTQGVDLSPLFTSTSMKWQAEQLPPSVASLLAERVGEPAAIESVTATEKAIVPGDQLYVIGHAKVLHDDRGAYREAPATIVPLAQTAPLFVSTKSEAEEHGASIAGSIMAAMSFAASAFAWAKYYLPDLLAAFDE